MVFSKKLAAPSGIFLVKRLKSRTEYGRIIKTRNGGTDLEALKAFLASLGLPGIFLGSMIPILELRASIPLGIGIGLEPAWVIIVSVIGNIVPVPFILIFIKKIFDWMKKHSKFLGSVAEKMEKKADRHKSTIEKYASLGLLILVAVPLPGTGAWTGSLVAAMFDIPMKKALPVISAGVMIAAAIVSAITFGVIAVI